MTTDDLAAAIAEIDLLTMRDWRGGQPKALDPAAHLAAVAASLERGRAVTIWQRERLAGYAIFVPRAPGLGFVSGLALHPERAGPGTIRRLMRAIAAFLAEAPFERLESHVFRRNRASVAMHRRLGFEVVQENEYGYAFGAPVARVLGALTGEKPPSTGVGCT